MLTYLKELMWDKAAARALLLFAVAAGGVYVAQPIGRSVIERVVTAAAVAAGVAGASAQSAASKKGLGG